MIMTPASRPGGLRVDLGPHACPFRPWRPEDGRAFGLFAFDAETTEIDDDRPDLVPAYVLGAATDGRTGLFVPRDRLAAFFRAHEGAEVIFHNASYDLKVIDRILRPGQNVYRAVEEGRVWDTMILHRLHTLGMEGHTARGCSGLADCVRAHLQLELTKDLRDRAGDAVRTGFGRYLGRPPSEVPEQHLAYLARDALAAFHLHAEFRALIGRLLRDAPGVWGYAGPA
jgi:hypothetical protein